MEQRLYQGVLQYRITPKSNWISYSAAELTFLLSEVYAKLGLAFPVEETSSTPPGPIHRSKTLEEPVKDAIDKLPKENLPPIVTPSDFRPEKDRFIKDPFVWPEHPDFPSTSPIFHTRTQDWTSGYVTSSNLK